METALENQSSEPRAQSSDENHNTSENTEDHKVAEPQDHKTIETTESTDNHVPGSSDTQMLGGSSLSGISNALKSDLKAQVEAVLFITDLPLKTGAIAKMLNASYDDVQSALVQLIQEYEDRNGGLEIGTDDGYIIQVKTQYLQVVTDMMPLELNPGPMRTLSAIALKEPTLQSEIIDIRGSGAYDHINELVEAELITKKPQGLSYTLRTTRKFQQYFRLTQDANKIKEKLQEEANRRAKEKELLKKQQEEEISKQESQPPVPS